MGKIKFFFFFGFLFWVNFDGQNWNKICRVQVLYWAVRTLKESGHEGVYDAVERPLLLAQSAAALEVLLSSLFFFWSFPNKEMK